MLLADRGFRTDQILVSGIGISESKNTDEKMIRFHQQVIAELRRLPGVIDAAGGLDLPVSRSHDIPGRQLLILRRVGFFWRPSFGSAKRPLSPAGKFQNREALSFQCIPQTPLRPSPPWPHNFAAPIASLYPLATASASIRRTMPANSRLVRWLSASLSQ